MNTAPVVESKSEWIERGEGGKKGGDLRSLMSSSLNSLKSSLVWVCSLKSG